MKKLVSLAALVSVALTGCVSNEEIIPEQKNKEISFEVASYVPQSRVSGAFSTTQSFGVNAWYTLDPTADVEGGAPADIETDQMMVEETVSYTLLVDKYIWKTSNAYYWPKKGTIDFIAYYPTTVIPTISYDYEGGDELTYTNYTVKNTDPTNPEPSDDLMYANKAIRFNNNKDATTNGTNLGFDGVYGFEGVPTLFNHALAQLKFKVQNAEPFDGTYKWIITVKKIEVICYDKGDVTLTNSGTTTASVGTWTTPNDVWIPSGNLITTPLTWEPTDAVTLSDGTEKVFDDKTVYILPQELVAGKQKVKVYYDVKVTNKNDELVDIHNDYEEEYDLSNGTLQYWQMNKIITYTVKFNPVGEMILFAPAVKEWDTESGSIVVM